MNELLTPDNRHGQTESAVIESSCADIEQTSKRKVNLKSSTIRKPSDVPCRRSARISAARENNIFSLFNVNCDEQYFPPKSVFRSAKKKVQTSTRRSDTTGKGKQGKKLSDSDCDCQLKFSMNSKQHKSLDSTTNPALYSTEQLRDLLEEDTPDSNLGQETTDQIVPLDKKEKSDDLNQMFKCIKMKSESKSHNDLKMKIKKCYKKSKRKDAENDTIFDKVPKDNGVLPKTSVQKEYNKPLKRKRQTCRKQFRHKDIQMYKLGSGPNKGTVEKKQVIQKIFHKTPSNGETTSKTNTDATKPKISENGLSGEKGTSHNDTIRGIAINNSSATSNSINENNVISGEMLETSTTSVDNYLTKIINKSTPENLNREFDTIVKNSVIPQLQISEEVSKVPKSSENGPSGHRSELGKHNLPIRIPERRSSIAQPLRTSPNFNKSPNSHIDQKVNPNLKNTEPNLLVGGNSTVATRNNFASKSTESSIIHRPYQLGSQTNGNQASVQTNAQVHHLTTGKQQENLKELEVRLIKSCSGITDPLKHKANQIQSKKDVTNYISESSNERLENPSLIRTNNQNLYSNATSLEKKQQPLHAQNNSNKKEYKDIQIGANTISIKPLLPTATTTNSITTQMINTNTSPLQSMPLLDMPDKVVPTPATTTDSTDINKKAKRRSPYSEIDGNSRTKYYKDNSYPTYDYNYPTTPLLNLLPPLSAFNRYLHPYSHGYPNQSNPYGIKYDAPSFTQPEIPPYLPFDTRLPHIPNLPPPEVYHYDHLKHLQYLPNQNSVITNYCPSINNKITAENTTKFSVPTKPTKVDNITIPISEAKQNSNKIEVACTPTPLTKTTNNVDTNAQCLSKIIKNEDLTVTKVPANDQPIDLHIPQQAQPPIDKEIKPNTNSPISPKSNHIESMHYQESNSSAQISPSDEIRIASPLQHSPLKEIITPKPSVSEVLLNNTVSHNPTPKPSPAETVEVNILPSPTKPCPSPFLISDSDTESDNEEKNDIAVNITKLKQNDSLSNPRSSPVKKEVQNPRESKLATVAQKRVMQTLNTLTYVVNEIIEKTGDNMGKQEKAVLHKLLEGVRQTSVATADEEESENQRDVTVKQEDCIEISSSDSEVSNDGIADTPPADSIVTLDLAQNNYTDNINQNQELPNVKNLSNPESVSTSTTTDNSNTLTPQTVTAHNPSATNAAPSTKPESRNSSTQVSPQSFHNYGDDETCGMDLSMHNKKNQSDNTSPLPNSNLMQLGSSSSPVSLTTTTLTTNCLDPPNSPKKINNIRNSYAAEERTPEYQLAKAYRKPFAASNPSFTFNLPKANESEPTKTQSPAFRSDSLNNTTSSNAKRFWNTDSLPARRASCNAPPSTPIPPSDITYKRSSSDSTFHCRSAENTVPQTPGVPAIFDHYNQNFKQSEPQANIYKYQHPQPINQSSVTIAPQCTLSFHVSSQSNIIHPSIPNTSSVNTATHRLPCPTDRSVNYGKTVPSSIQNFDLSSAQTDNSYVYSPAHSIASLTNRERPKSLKSTVAPILPKVTAPTSFNNSNFSPSVMYQNTQAYEQYKNNVVAYQKWQALQRQRMAAQSQTRQEVNSGLVGNNPKTHPQVNRQLSNATANVNNAVPGSRCSSVYNTRGVSPKESTKHYVPYSTTDASLKCGYGNYNNNVNMSKTSPVLTNAPPVSVHLNSTEAAVDLRNPTAISQPNKITNRQMQANYSHNSNSNFKKSNFAYQTLANNQESNTISAPQYSVAVERQFGSYPLQRLPEIKQSVLENTLVKKGDRKPGGSMFNENKSPDYGYCSPLAKSTATVESTSYPSVYPQCVPQTLLNVQDRRMSSSSQHSSIGAPDNQLTDMLLPTSNCSTGTTASNISSNDDNKMRQLYSPVLAEKHQAILARMLPKLQSLETLTPELYVREISILEKEGCPKSVLEFYSYVTKKQIASNRLPIGFRIFLEFQNAGKLKVFENAFKIYSEKCEKGKVVPKDK